MDLLLYLQIQKHKQKHTKKIIDNQLDKKTHKQMTKCYLPLNQGGFYNQIKFGIAL